MTTLDFEITTEGEVLDNPDFGIPVFHDYLDEAPSERARSSFLANSSRF
jgi:hypothetical protein